MELSTESIKAKLNEYISECGSDITCQCSRYVGAWEITREIDDVYALSTNGQCYEVVVSGEHIESVSLLKK